MMGLMNRVVDADRGRMVENERNVNRRSSHDAKQHHIGGRRAKHAVGETTRCNIWNVTNEK